MNKRTVVLATPNPTNETNDEESSVKFYTPMKRSLSEDESLTESIFPQIKKAPHPWPCRLHDSAAFDVSSPESLIGAGIASLMMAIVTVFRYAPLLLYSMVDRFRSLQVVTKVHEKVAFIVSVFWLGLILFLFIVLGLVLLFATKIKNRKILLLHPWAMLLLYFDFLVWLGVTVSVHLKFKNSQAVKDDTYYLILLSVVYIDIIFYAMLYYLYATYFIAAELTVIERFY